MTLLELKERINNIDSNRDNEQVSIYIVDGINDTVRFDALCIDDSIEGIIEINANGNQF